MGKQNTTVHEVAKRTGVSIATVSRVVRGVGQVSPETRQRVQEAIAELGYRPSRFGRALVERRHSALGIVFPGLAGPYYSEVIQGFEAEAVTARQSVLIFGTHLLEQSEDQVLDMASRVDGMAIMGGTLSNECVQTLIDQEVPIVLLARHPMPNVPTVRVENTQSTRDITLHLLTTHGYDPIYFIGNPTGSPDTTDRWEGFVAAHRQVGREPGALIRVGFQQADGVWAISQILEAGELPRAIVCANDEIALGVHAALTARGVRIPEQVALTGWDDIPMARLIAPALSTVCQPTRELGSQTAKLLLARIKGELDEPPDVVLPTEVIIRQSCGCTHEAATNGQRSF
ncbi:MAG: LacI family DNA-binding transcriptional regulator [Chloroflexi bacterium]|nr:LacI family DNA-binding transcriptional regulator [Chloroflexota bacterium]